MVSKEKLKKAHEYDFRKAVDLKDFVAVKGHDFSKKFDLKQFLESYKTTGFQATNLWTATEIIKKMREEKVTIMLTYTSNLVTSGLRDVIAYLVKNKFVNVLCTTGGGIEEDIMKCMKPFAIGDFRGDSKQLYTKGLNRTGNIYVSDRIYMKFEDFFLPILQKFYDRQMKEGKVATTLEIIRELGVRINDKTSILYWAAKNEIPVFCPSLVDGAMGDMIWFFRHKHPEFRIDVVEDVFRMNNIPLDSKETGIIALGSGLPRHYALNSNIFRGGTKYAVYINSGNEWDGSTSSSKPGEAYSWGKIKLSEPFEKNSVEVVGDATIIFPLIVAGSFMR